MTKIDKNTIEFLRLLSVNNNKEWFDNHRSMYTKAKNNIEIFVQELINEIIEFEPVLKGLEAKSCIYRINRDIRFSNDKTPYKTNFGALIMKGGRKNFFKYPGYYLHIEPDNCFLAGGAYMPSPDWLTAIREKISEQPDMFLKIINNVEFRKHYGEIQGEKLKKAPKGFDPAHKHIELLKYKNYFVDIQISEKQIFESDYLKYILNVFRTVKPFHDFLDFDSVVNS